VIYVYTVLFVPPIAFLFASTGGILAFRRRLGLAGTVFALALAIIAAALFAGFMPVLIMAQACRGHSTC